MRVNTSDLHIVLRDVGGLLVLVGALMLAPLLVSLVYREYYCSPATVSLSRCCRQRVRGVDRLLAES